MHTKLRETHREHMREKESTHEREGEGERSTMTITARETALDYNLESVINKTSSIDTISD